LHHEIEIFSLSAVDKKVLSTTNERKVMSKTTFFKRVALTAIAALGLGMLSVAPSQAAAGVPTISVEAGSATYETGNPSDTSTAAFVTVSGLLSTTSDSYTVSFARKSFPTGGLDTSEFRSFMMDSGTTGYTAQFSTDPTAPGTESDAAVSTTYAAYGDADFDSDVVTKQRIIFADAIQYVGVRIGIMLDTATARTATSHGDYVFTAIVTPYTSGVAGTPATADVTFTLAREDSAAAAASGTIDPSKSTAYLGSGTASPTADGANITALATSSTTTRATLAVRTYTSASLQAPESVTVTITGPGLVGTSASGVWGKSITAAATGATDFLIRSDGTAGTASIAVSTTTVTFPAKTMTFYAAAASTVEVSTARPVIGVGTTGDVIRATFKDATGNVWAGAAYIYAATAADALIGGSSTPVACTWDATDNRHECPVNGLTAGTASFKVIDASTVAAATTTSDAASTRVSTGIATTAVLSFDKATYAPGEKAQLRVSVLDGAGLAMPGVTITNGLAAGILTSRAFGANSATISGTTLALSGVTSAAADLNAGHVTYVVYMPSQAGVVTVSAVGGTGLAAAGRVAISATATVEAPVDPTTAAAAASAEAATDAALEAIDAANAATDAANLAAEAADAATVAAEEARDAADAATAAVEALAGEVATLMAALKAQITTLAKTVAKIAKKVKA
jgi:hypothetical protein